MALVYLAVHLLISSTVSGLIEAGQCQLGTGNSVSLKNTLVKVRSGMPAVVKAWTGTFEDCCQECCHDPPSCQQGYFIPSISLCMLSARTLSSHSSPYAVNVFNGCEADGITCKVDTTFQILHTNMNNALMYVGADVTIDVVDPDWNGTLQDCCNECCGRDDCRAGWFYPTEVLCYMYSSTNSSYLSVYDGGSPLTSATCVPPPPPAPAADSTGSSSSKGVIAGSIVGALALALVCGVVAVIVLRKRRSRQMPKPPPAASAESLPEKAASYGMLSAPASVSTEEMTRGLTRSLLLPTHTPFVGANRSNISSGFASGKALAFDSSKLSGASLLSSLTQDLTGTEGSNSSGPPPDGSPRAFLAAQLDALHREKALLCGRFRLGDRGDRRTGGQGVVQFATHVWQDKREYAIKFYLNEGAFATEKAVLSNPAMKDVMPLVDEVVCAEADGVSVLGRPLPPLVVIEKGESLDFWRARAEVDFPSAMHILLHVVECAAAMHAAGIVHRDLKPANIIFYPARNKWNIIDFGAAAKIGTEAPLACTLAYAAPETVLALMRGNARCVADPSVDVFSLGLMGWELLTLTCTFGGREQVEEAMAGRAQLPWEQVDSLDFKSNMRKLGWMKNDILRMLACDPAERATLPSVLSSWQSYLRRSSIFQTTVDMPQSS